MKLVLAALLLAGLSGTSVAAETYCEKARVPDGLKPLTVNVDVYILPRAKIHSDYGCSVTYRDVTACTFQHPTDPHTWVVLVSDDVPAGPEFECVMKYEQAHMPPNFWADPKVETPQTMRYLADLKSKHR